MRTKQIISFISLLMLSACSGGNANNSVDVELPAHPRLVSNSADIVQMRNAITQPGVFTDTFVALQQQVDAQLLHPMIVPLPADAGGGYTHEKHKTNYQLMNNAGILYQLTQDMRYANAVKDMLLAYAEMYPTLGYHPKRKEQSPGKLFWQSLNEAMWLVYTSQAYDNIKLAISTEDATAIENGVLRPMALFLSVENPQTFNKVHNHGTWANAAVGMTGLVLGELEWVEQALLGLDKSGDAGFLKQLEVLFSPDGYYNEGPYYQRFALLPFVLFAKAVEENQPERDIFGYRDGVLLKAINTTIQLSYNGLFFAINDAIKDKGTDTIELVYGVSIAYGLSQDTGLLSIAKQQNQILLTGDGLKVAQALEQQKATPYGFANLTLGDGANGDDGALIINRQNQTDDVDETVHQALVFKATSQGLGHGHFDKLNYIFYDNGEEIVRDYGAARFLNVEAKYGGHYLAENNSYAKQTISHNTLIVDEQSHFAGNTALGNQHAPNIDFVVNNDDISISKATMRNAYDGVVFDRTMAMFSPKDAPYALIIDVLNVQSEQTHQYDLPVHYQGQLIETNFSLNTALSQMNTLGNSDGYQHIWQTAKAQTEGELSQITWLLNNRFYTHSSYTPDTTEILFGRAGANDPNFNLIEDKMFMLRVQDSREHQFINVLEPHGEYNGSKEFTINSHSQIQALSGLSTESVQVVALTHNQQSYLIAYAQELVANDSEHTFEWEAQRFTFAGQVTVIALSDTKKIKHD